MSDIGAWLNQNKILIGLAIQLLGVVFAAGVLWQRMKSLEKVVLNGIMSRQNSQEDVIEQLTVATSVMAERCEGREKWINKLEKAFDRLNEQGKTF